MEKFPQPEKKKRTSAKKAGDIQPAYDAVNALLELATLGMIQSPHHKKKKGK